MNQQKWWKGQEGNNYTDRNREMTGRIEMFAKLLMALPQFPHRILEVGANRGLNLTAINEILNDSATLIGLEPNEIARHQIPFNSIDGVAQNIPLDDDSVDLTFSCGVLIHIHPDELEQACREIYRVSSKYIICIEYFSDKLEMITYQGKENLLWKQDFGKLYMNLFPDLTLIDCRFFWKEATGLDNVTAWVFEK